jgi:hypothetical protein
MKISTMLAKGKSLQQISDSLNAQRVRRPHGEATWTPRNVRRAFVS